MVKLLVFAILVASASATSLLDGLYQIENKCYKGCDSNYGAKPNHLNACRKGCDFKLYNEDCATQCKTVSAEEEVQASCQVGCSLNIQTDEVDSSKPIIAIDPVPEIKESDTTPVSVPEERPRSLILIRIRQHPTGEFPSMPMGPMGPMHPFFHGDPIKMFNDMIKQFHERAFNMEQSVRKSFEENSENAVKLPGIGIIKAMPNNIPIVHIPLDTNSDSSSKENQDSFPPMRMHHMGFDHRGRHMQHMPHMYERNHNNRFQQFITDVRSEWNDLVRKQPKIPIWIFLAVFLSSSAILWYMVMSLCRHTPSRNTLSIRAQELIFHPYDYEAYEKEKIQPDDQPYEVTESLPIKVKLTNI